MQVLMQGWQGHTDCSEKLVDIRPLKAFVQRCLPKRSLLRELILAEDDFISPWLFMASVRLWLRLLDLELMRKSLHQRLLELYFLHAVEEDAVPFSALPVLKLLDYSRQKFLYHKIS